MTDEYPGAWMYPSPEGESEADLAPELIRVRGMVHTAGAHGRKELAQHLRMLEERLLAMMGAPGTAEVRYMDGWSDAQGADPFVILAVVEYVGNRNDPPTHVYYEYKETDPEIPPIPGCEWNDSMIHYYEHGLENLQSYRGIKDEMMTRPDPAHLNQAAHNLFTSTTGKVVRVPDLRMSEDLVHHPMMSTTRVRASYAEYDLQIPPRPRIIQRFTTPTRRP